MLNNKIILKVSKSCFVSFLSANQILHITNDIIIKFILFFQWINTSNKIQHKITYILH